MSFSIRPNVRALSFPTWSIPVALLALTGLTYGLRARSLGFYWDDWPYLWLFHRLGSEGIVKALAEDRPFLSFLYTTSFSIFGQSALAWQSFALLARWLCSLCFWWMLAQAWPGQQQKTTWAAVLFTVYPGFTQQWIAVIYGQAFLLYAPVFASIAITLWLARRSAALPRWQMLLAAAAALVLSAFSMFSTEYFFGLELLRPLLLVVVLAAAGQFSPNWWRGLWRALLWWLPWLVLMIVFIVWRAFIQVFPGHELTVVEGLRQSFFGQLAALALTITGDVLEATLAAWGQVLRMEGLLEANPSAGVRTLAVILLIGLAAWMYLARLRHTEPGAGRGWGWQAMLVGLLALLAGGWPFWITDLPMRLGFPQDRYTLPLAPGASLLLAGGIDWLGRRGWRKAAAIGLLVGLAAGFHNTNALQYRAEWNSLRSFFWQLTWRAPSIAPATLLVVDRSPFQLYEDDSLLAPLNWTYDPQSRSREMQLTLFDLQVRFQNLAEMPAGTPIEKDYRGMQFHGSTDRVLVLAYPPGGCLTVLDPQFDAENYRLTDGLLRVLPLSQPQALIQPADIPAEPPQSIFGTEPEHGWCYYYTKASLARQQQDWAAIFALGEASIDQGMRPQRAEEYLPFVEGYLRYGLPYDAYQLTLDAYSLQPGLRPALCAVWQRAEETGSAVPEVLLGSGSLRAAPGCELATMP